jgi:hypothetical protein
VENLRRYIHVDCTTDCGTPTLPTLAALLYALRNLA